MRISLFCLLLSALLFPSLSRAEAPVFVITPLESSIKFDVEASVAIRGTFDKWNATLIFASPDVTTGVLDVEIQAASDLQSDVATIEKVRLMFRPVNCYRLRHSYSVRLLLACGNKEIVQKALGHANIQTTDIYTTMVVDPRLQDAVRRAFGT